MTNERAMEILIDELPYTSGVIEEAIKTVKSALEKQIPKSLMVFMTKTKVRRTRKLFIMNRY